MSLSSMTPLLIALLLISGLRAYTYDAFSASIPPGDVGALYSSYYTNLQTFLPCTLTGRVSSTLKSPVTVPVGCVPFQGGSFFSTVFPLSLSSANELSVACRAGTVASNNTLEKTFGGFQAGRPAEGIILVLSAAAVSGEIRYYNLSCIVQSVELWNSLVATAPVLGEHVSGIVVNDATVTFFGKSLSSYNDVASNSLLWSAHRGVSLILLRTSISDVALSEFEAVVRAAHYNLASADVTIATPMAVQYVGQMASAASINSSCLADATCQPIGGLNMIGTTASSAWSLTENSNDSFVKTTPDGSVAIVVSSSSVGLFHDAIPAADAAASGIVAALLAVDALVRAYGDALSSNHSAPQLFAMFLVGEEYNLTGSSRLVEEASAFVCHQFPAEASAAVVDCTYPNYRNLNFTTVNVSAIRHFIQIEQVGNSSEPLRVHVDLSLNSTITQAEANHAFAAVAGVEGASSVALPASSPLLSFMGHNDALSSYSLISRYDARYANPLLFTPSDVSSELSIDAVKDAASRISLVVASLLGRSGTDLIVNATLAAELWYCFTENFDCLSLGGSGASVVTPNYYTSVFQYDAIVQPYQSLIQTQLLQQSGSISAPLNVFATHAFSIGATYEDTAVGTFGFNGNSTSVWVESNWGAIGSRVATITSATGYELMAFGIIVNVCVFAGLYCSYLR
jgi:hypothetical protein